MCVEFHPLFLFMYMYLVGHAQAVVANLIYSHVLSGQEQKNGYHVQVGVLEAENPSVQQALFLGSLLAPL